MQNTKITNNLELFKEEDIINLILYAVYKNTKDFKYSTISELIYCLGKDDLYKFCATFGGTTIKVPTIEELLLYTKALLVYQQVLLKTKTFDEAVKDLNLNQQQLDSVIAIYNTLIELGKEYDRDTL